MSDTASEVERARELLGGILERMEIPGQVSVQEEEDKVVLEIQCERDDDVQRVIGRRGAVVDALQHLIGKMMARVRNERGKPIVVDAGGYRQKHIERLEGLAERTAEKCRSSGAPVDLNPMSPHDRRVVHLAVAEMEGVSTRSEGEGDLRHVVVVPGDE